MQKMISSFLTSRWLRKNKPARLLKDNVEFLQDLYHSLKPMSDAVAIENITDCNRKCPYCPHFWQERKSLLMPEPIYRKIIHDLAQLSYEGTLVFAPWSEPLLDDRLTGFIEYAKARLPRCRVTLLTNGDLLTLKKFRELAFAGTDMIDVSDHYTILDGRYAALKPEQAVKTYRRLGEEERKILHFHKHNDRKIRGLERFHNRSGLVPLKNCILLKLLQHRCSFPEKILAVNHKGDVLLCARQWTEKPAYGNVAGEGLRAIWKKKEYVQERKALRKGFFRPEVCQKCGCGDLLTPEEVLELKASRAVPKEGKSTRASVVRTDGQLARQDNREAVNPRT